MVLLFTYIFCALIATCCNLLAQWVFHSLLPIMVSMTEIKAEQTYLNLIFFWTGLFGGTFIGLVVKYYLDKNYIFHFKNTGVKKEIKTMFLYFLMGIFTTTIFWWFEWYFESKWGIQARYLGGALGLTIGYFVKYRLDKRFVFR